MPCHDKKLEAEQKDLAWERFIEQQDRILVPDVYLVITINELMTLIMDDASLELKDGQQSLNIVDSQDNDSPDNGARRLKNVRKFFHDLPNEHEPSTTSDSLFMTEGKDEQAPKSLTNSNNNDHHNHNLEPMKGSGSYADFIFRFASKAPFGYDIPSHEALPWKSTSRQCGGSGGGG